MFDIQRLFNDTKNFIHVRESNNGALYVALPLFHPNNDESIAVCITETEDGRPVFSDCGTTVDYLELNYINVDDYPERVAEICERYYLKRDGGLFIRELPTNSPNYVLTAFYSFVGALSILANIDIK